MTLSCPLPFLSLTVLNREDIGDVGLKVGCEKAAYCIPPKSNTAEPWDVDWWQYKERSRVECFFQKIKNYRRIAARYDKLAVRFLGFVHLVCILIWLM